MDAIVDDDKGFDMVSQDIVILFSCFTKTPVIFLINASMQVPMLQVYGTIIGRLTIMRCEILHVSVISTNRSLVFASTTFVALTGLSHTAARVTKRRRALLWAVCCSHVPFE
jgi:hypothetical protein